MADKASVRRKLRPRSLACQIQDISNLQNKTSKLSSASIKKPRIYETIVISDTDSDSDNHEIGIEACDTFLLPNSNVKSLFTANFGQNPNRCAGISMATISIYFTNGCSLNVNASNISDISMQLNEHGENYYRAGCKFEKKKPNDNFMIEFPSIRDSITADRQCVIEFNTNLKVKIATPDTAIIDQTNARESDFVFSDSGDNISEILEQYLNGRNNVVIYSAIKQHFVTILKNLEDYLIVDGLGGFKFITLTLEGVLSWCKEFVGSEKYSLTTARIMLADEPLMQVDEAVLQPENEEQIDTDEESSDILTLQSESSTNEEDVIGTEKGVRGNCMKQKCRTKIKKDGFCHLHLLMVERELHGLANSLKVKCSMENCFNHAVHNRNFCNPHSHSKPCLEREYLSVTILLDIAQKSITKYIIPLAQKGIKFYVGMSYSLGQRSIEHYSMSKCEDCITLFTAKDVNEASLMESIFVHLLLFNESKIVRDNLANSVGGGCTPSRVHEASYKVYVVYDKKGLLTPGHIDSLKFEDGFLSTDELSEIIDKVLIEKVLKFAKQKRLIKFGFSRTQCFENRMAYYNSLHNEYEHFENVAKSRFDSCILLSSESTHVLSNGNEVVLSMNDIRKAEVMCVSKFLFGNLRQFSSLLLNVGSGGDISRSKEDRESEFIIDENITANLYFRLGKIGKVVADFKTKKETKNKEFYAKDIPLNKDGKYNWRLLVPKSKAYRSLGWKIKKPWQNEKKHFCKCGDGFTNVKSLRYHQKNCGKALSGRKVLPCPFEDCPDTFAHNNSRKRHVRRFHSSKKVSRRSLSHRKMR